MTIPAFRIKRAAQAVALALAFGASIQVVQAANQTYCSLGLPGMGCNLPTTPGEGVDSTMVGSLPTPTTQQPPPSWGGGGNTIAGFLQQNAGRTIQIYDSGYYDTVNTGYLSFSASGLRFVTEAQVVPGSGDWGGYFLPLNTNSSTTATPLNPTGQAEVGANFPNGHTTQAASSFLGSLSYSVFSDGVCPLFSAAAFRGALACFPGSHHLGDQSQVRGRRPDFFHPSVPWQGLLLDLHQTCPCQCIHIALDRAAITAQPCGHAGN